MDIRDNVRFEEFRIGDLFDVFKGRRLTKADQTPGSTPFIGSTDSNNGVTGYIGQDPIFKGNAITVTYNGSVGQAFYQEEPFWASDDVNVLYLKDMEIDRMLYEYLGTCLKKAGTAFSYTYKWTVERMKATFITLPTTPDGTPDYDYMRRVIKMCERDYIDSLERERLETLDRYLAETGLDDYALTGQELKMLYNDTINLKEFQLSEIFETKPYRGGLQVPTGGLVSQSDLIPGNVPRISVTNTNNGIIGYYQNIKLKDYRVYENCISFSFLGTIFYHPYKASFDMKVHCLKPKNHEFGEDALYIVAILKKFVANCNYGNQMSSTDIPKLKIKLPTTPDGTPDWDYMARYIRAVEKLTIKDVAEWKDRELELTRRAVQA